MKTELEIQRAHDLLVGVLLDEVRTDASDETRNILNIVAGTLCWVLDHNHNPTVGKMLASIEQDLNNAGFILAPTATGHRSIKED